MRATVRRVIFGIIGVVALLVAGLGLPPAQPVRAAGSVTSCADDGGPGTLRSVMAGGGTVTFAVDCPSSGPIILTLGTLTISANTTIDASVGNHTVVVDGGCTANCGTQSAVGGVRVFAVNGGVTANLTALTIQHGNNTDNFAGGGIRIFNDGTLTVTNSTVTGNSAVGNSGGGIFLGTGSTLTVTNSTFSNNSGNVGGGINNSVGTLTVTNSTFVGNTASIQGGAFVAGSLTTSSSLINCTLTGNAAPSGSGGGIRSFSATTITNTIVSGNTGGDISETVSSIRTTSLVGGTPLLDPAGLADHGGPTRTVALLPGSPAINAGTAGAGVPTTDQRAKPRVGATDIGAFESQGFTLTKVPGGDNQSTADTAAFPNPLAVTVSSSTGEPIDGGQVTFTANPGGSGQSATLTGSPATIASGQASVTATANTVLGSYTVTASAAGATDVTFTLTNIPGAAATLTPSPATPQSAAITTAFPTLSVTVTDAGGNAVADGTPVTFSVTAAGNGASATLAPASPVVTTGGVASITATANTIAGGPYTVTATSNGQTATFTLTNLPGPAASITASAGTPQHTTVNTTFPTSLTATVTDSGGNPVGAGIGVTFTIVPASGAGGSFPGPATTATATTTASGIATAPTLTANTTAGTFTVTASTPGATDATFTLTNDPGPATTLALSGYPASVVAGTSNAFTVTARDQFGNTATGYTGTVHFTSTDTLAALPANYPFVAGDAGVHTFMASFGAAGTWSVTATDTATSTITGTQSGITVTAVGTTTTLTISPSPAAHGNAVTLTATVAPASATNLPTPAGSVTFLDGSTPLGTVTLVSGVATFTTSTLTVGLHHLTATYTPASPGPYTTSTGTGDVTITAAALVSITVTPASTTLKAGQVQQYTATGTYADSSTADLTSAVTWTSDTPHVASVDASGKVTGASPGAAHITATQGNVSGQASVTVSAPTAIGIAPGAAPGSRPGGASAPPAPGATPAPAPTGR